VLALLGAASALLAGCGGTDPSAHAQTVAARPTATAEATTSHCQSGTPILPQGWSWHHDARYPFQIAFPSGWRSGSFEYTPLYLADGQVVPWAHVVDFFPPGGPGLSSSMGKMRGDLVPRVIYIQVDEFPQAVFHPNDSWRPDTPQICLSGTLATAYTGLGDPTGISKTVVVQPANQSYPYAFYLNSPAATTPQDSALFADMLKTFVVSTTP
jgi:hypothetical protein